MCQEKEQNYEKENNGRINLLDKYFNVIELEDNGKQP